MDFDIVPKIADSLATPFEAKLRRHRDSGTSPDIIDIRGEHEEINLKEEVISMFKSQKGPRRLPTMLLYSEKGLQMFEDVSSREIETDASSD